MTRADTRPLILHVVYSFGVGGLENGVVNLINHMPAERWRHAVLALDRVVPGFRARVQRDDVQFVELGKRPGHLVTEYPKLGRLFRELSPAIVHTRNLAALEATVPAWFAGVPVRIHGEHGRDARDPDGRDLRRRLIRRLYRPFVHQYIALSYDLERYLQEQVGVPAARVRHIFNGVDSARFRVAGGRREAITGSPFNGSELFVFGTVGRLDPVKDHVGLVHAFAELLRRHPDLESRARLVIVGEGPERGAIEAAVAAAGLSRHVWQAGERHDIPELLRGFDCFVLPSLAEGISNTILEAMACGLPVVATRVGANADLVAEGVSGRIVERRDTTALAEAMAAYMQAPGVAHQHGAAGRRIVESRFSIDRMVGDYEDVYERLLDTRAPRLVPKPGRLLAEDSAAGLPRH